MKFQFYLVNFVGKLITLDSFSRMFRIHLLGNAMVYASLPEILLDFNLI